LGSSKPQTVEYTLPSAEAIKKAGLGAKQFLQVTPEESFQLAGEYGKYLEDRTRYAKELSDRAFGSSSERGALDLERNAARELAYAASLPRGDAYISGSSSGGSYDTEENDPYKQIRDLTQITYADALKRAAEKRAYADSGAEAADFASQPYNPVFEKLASGGYEGPYPVSQGRVDTLRAQRRRRQRERERRRNAMA
jgi:hypothetical protein